MRDDRRAAFEALVTNRSPRLLRSAYLLTGNWATAEDLLQTTLAKAWFRWGTLRDIGAAEAYVRTTMARTYASWWRRKWRGELPTEQLPEQAGTDEFAAYDERDRLLRALAALTPRARAMVILRFFDDLSDQQVADAMSCSVGTVKSTVSRALASLRPRVGVPATTSLNTEHVHE